MSKCMLPVLLAIPTLTAALIAQEANPPVGAEDAQALAHFVQLLNTPIIVASARPRTLLESPGVVTCVRQEEIRASGARDLIDVLRLIPGFDLAYDNSSATGLSVRGLWAYEGKALILWDGIDMTDLVAGTTPVGHRFPVDQIQRIEVIRGPGSVKYGGNAELAVINIISLDASSLDGLAAGVTWGSGSGHTLRQAGQLLFGHTFASDLQISLGATYEKGRRSAESWIDNSGNPREAAPNSEMSSGLFNLGVQWKGLRIRALLDDTHTRDLTWRPTAVFQEQAFESSSQNLTLSWELPLRKGLKLTPYASYRRNTPNQRSLAPKDNPLSRTVLRLRAGARVDWDLSEALYASLGAEHTQDDASTGADTSSSFSLGTNKARFATYRDDAAFLEMGYSGPVNMLLGARWEAHSAAGSSFVPRFAITKAWGDWHFKLLHAKAFRTPAALHFRTSTPLASGLKPERTRTSELEVGYQNRTSLIRLNLFDIRLDEPIYDSGPSVQNGPSTGSRGVELDYSLHRNWGFLNASYSYHAALDNQVVKWSVPGQESRFLAVAQHKVTALASIWMPRGFSMDPSLTWLGARYGGQWNPDRRKMLIQRFDPALLLNLQVSYRWKELTFSVAGFDLLDHKPNFLQAYFNLQAPLPDGGREAVLKARWNF